MHFSKLNSELITYKISFNKSLPIESIIKCNKIFSTIYINQSHPEQLVQDLKIEIRKILLKVSIEEIVLLKENVCSFLNYQILDFKLIILQIV